MNETSVTNWVVYCWGFQDEAAELSDRARKASIASLAKGPSRQIRPDSDFLATIKGGVRGAVLDCSKHARNNNAQRKRTSMQSLRMNDGRPVEYSKKGRKGIDPVLLQRLLCAPLWSACISMT